MSITMVHKTKIIAIYKSLAKQFASYCTAVLSEILGRPIREIILQCCAWIHGFKFTHVHKDGGWATEEKKRL